MARVAAEPPTPTMNRQPPRSRGGREAFRYTVHDVAIDAENDVERLVEELAAESHAMMKAFV